MLISAWFLMVGLEQKFCHAQYFSPGRRTVEHHLIIVSIMGILRKWLGTTPHLPPSPTPPLQCPSVSHLVGKRATLNVGLEAQLYCKAGFWQMQLVVFLQTYMSNLALHRAGPSLSSDDFDPVWVTCFMPSVFRVALPSCGLVAFRDGLFLLDCGSWRSKYGYMVFPTAWDGSGLGQWSPTFLAPGTNALMRI